MTTENVTMEEVGTALKQYKSDIEAKIDTLATKQSDAANKEIDSLKAEIKNLNEGIEKMKEAAEDKKSFGMPGLEDELKSGKEGFSITKYLLAQYLHSAQGKSQSLGTIGDFNSCVKAAGAEAEYDIAREYYNKREASIAKRPADVRKAFESDDGTSGGYLVPPEASQEIIDLTIANMPLLNMSGIKYLKNLHGDLMIPKVTARNTGYWVGETEAPTESTGTFGQVWLRPKKVAGFTKQSNRLLYQTRGTSDTIIKGLLSDAVSLKWHEGLLNGTGSESQPKGILQYDGMTTTSDGSATLTASSKRFTLDKAQAMWQGLANADEMRDTNTYGYLMHPVVLGGMMRQKVVQYSGQDNEDGAPIDAMNILMDQAKIENILRYPVKHTTQMPKDASNDTSVLFGDWSQFWVGQFREPIFRVSDQASDGSTGSAFLQDQLYIVMFIETDCQLMRETAIAKCVGASTVESNWV